MTTPHVKPIGSPERLSICTICLAGSPLDEALAVIADAGYAKIDLLGRMPHFSVDSQEWDPDRLERLCERHGLQVAGIGTYFGINLRQSSGSDQIEAELRAARRGIEIASRFGARAIRVAVGDRSPESAFALTSFLQEVSDYASAHDICAGVETHGGITSDPQGMAEVCRRVDRPNFGVIYDPCNLERTGTDYKDAYEVLREHVVHVHLKDGRREGDAYRLTMFGDGDIDMAWVLKKLEADGYAGDVALEYEISKVEPPETGLAEWRRRYEDLASKLG